MPLHWPTFFTRLGSAVVFAAIMMVGLLWNEWAFLALVALIQVLCLRDYFRLMGKIFVGTVGVLHVLAQIFGLGLLTLIRTEFWPVTLFVPVLMMLAGFLTDKVTKESALSGLAGLIYIVLPCVLLPAIYGIAWFFPLVLILCIWMNDTMAYLVGSFIGKTPFSKISPKKTWEGTVGGAILTVAGAAVAAWLIPSQSMAAYIGIALCAAVAGTAGDLLESKLKRIAGVKDSGAMMPGHGGALDRFDSLLVATPFAFAWLYLLQLL